METLALIAALAAVVAFTIWLGFKTVRTSSKSSGINEERANVAEEKVEARTKGDEARAEALPLGSALAAGWREYVRVRREKARK